MKAFLGDFVKITNGYKGRVYRIDKLGSMQAVYSILVDGGGAVECVESAIAEADGNRYAANMATFSHPYEEVYFRENHYYKK